MGKRLGLVINPTAGNGNGLIQGEIALQQLQSGAQVVDLTGSTLQASEENVLLEIAKNQLDGLVVVGGDGMVHVGVNLCATFGLPLGIIAAGTGNDAARSLGLPINDAIKAANTVLVNLDNPRSVDLVRAKTSSEEFYFFGNLLIDFVALVNQRANSWSWPKGPSRYTIAMLVELARFRPTRYTATIDGVEKVFQAMLCTIANSPYFGGGMKFAPGAAIDDGYLDLFIVNKISRLELLKVFPKVFSGAHITHPAVEFIRAKKITLATEKLMPAFSDGEPVGFSPVVAEVIPDALKVYATSAPRASVAD